MDLNNLNPYATKVAIAQAELRLAKAQYALCEYLSDIGFEYEQGHSICLAPDFSVEEFCKELKKEELRKFRALVGRLRLRVGQLYVCRTGKELQL